MTTNKTLSVLAASSVLAFFALSPAYAQSIPEEEQQQLDNSAQPDVDPGASKGPDAPITDEEKMQLGNQPGPDVLPDASGPNSKSQESIPSEEQKDIEN
jgi:hypothetical protein